MAKGKIEEQLKSQQIQERQIGKTERQVDIRKRTIPEIEREKQRILNLETELKRIQFLKGRARTNYERQVLSAQESFLKQAIKKEKDPKINVNVFKTISQGKEIYIEGIKKAEAEKGERSKSYAQYLVERKLAGKKIVMDEDILRNKGYDPRIVKSTYRQLISVPATKRELSRVAGEKIQEKALKEEAQRYGFKDVREYQYRQSEVTKPEKITMKDIPAERLGAPSQKVYEEKQEPYLKQELVKTTGIKGLLTAFGFKKPETELYYFDPTTEGKRLATQEEELFYQEQLKLQKEEEKKEKKSFITYLGEQTGPVSMGLELFGKGVGKSYQITEEFKSKIPLFTTPSDIFYKKLGISQKQRIEVESKVIEKIAPAGALIAISTFVPLVGAALFGGLAFERFSPATKKQIEERTEFAKELGFSEAQAELIGSTPADIKFVLSTIGAHRLIKAATIPEVKFIGYQQVKDVGKIKTDVFFRVNRGGIISMPEYGAIESVTKITSTTPGFTSIKYTDSGYQFLTQGERVKFTTEFIGGTMDDVGFLGTEKGVTETILKTDTSAWLQQAGKGKMFVTKQGIMDFISKDMGVVFEKGTFSSGFSLTEEGKASISAGGFNLKPTPIIKFKAFPNYIQELFYSKRGQASFFPATPSPTPQFTEILTSLDVESQAALLSTEAATRTGIMTSTSPFTIGAFAPLVSTKVRNIEKPEISIKSKEDIITKEDIFSMSKSLATTRLISPQKQISSTRQILQQQQIKLPSIPITPTTPSQRLPSIKVPIVIVSPFFQGFKPPKKQSKISRRKIKTKVSREPSLAALGLKIKSPKRFIGEETGLTIRPIISKKRKVKKKKKKKGWWFL